MSKNTALVMLNCNENSIYDESARGYVYCLASLNVKGCTALQVLRCYNNYLTTLDLSNNTALTYLDCDGNRLTALDVSNNTALTELHCWYNRLTTLDVSNNTALVYLDCSENRITELDVSGHKALQEIYCYDNEEYPSLKTLNASGCTSLTIIGLDYASRLTHMNLSGCTSLTDLYYEGLLSLTELDASGCTSLTYLYCSNEESQGSLTSLNLTGCTALESLTCSYNKLTSLNLSTLTNLRELYCAHNALTALDVSKNSALERLECSYNYLTTLNVSSNTALTDIACRANYLTSLNLSSNSALTDLYCSHNDLKTLDVSNNSALVYLECYDNNLTALDVSNNLALTDLDCYSNNLATLDVSNNSALVYLECYDNNLTALNLSSNTNLEKLFCRNNNISELDLSSNNSLNHIDITYNNSSSMDLNACIANGVDEITCDFPITTASNSSYEFDFTAFKAAYGLDCELNDNYDVTVWYNNKLLSYCDTYTPSGRYILRFLRLADSKLLYVSFRCNMNNLNKYIYINLYPFESSSSTAAPLITTSSLPAVSVVSHDNYSYYDSYEQPLSAYGSKPLSWKITDGFLPAGFYMDEDGYIYGEPIASGSYTFTVRARNKLGSSTRTFTITVPTIETPEPPLITTTSLTGGTKGIPYGFQLTATGTPTIEWKAEELPDGLTLSSTGYISGTPSAAGTFSLIVYAYNEYNDDFRTLSLTVAEPPSGTKPSITTKALDDATTGTAYSYQLGVSGTPPFTWTVKGKLPAGLSINSSGLITGTPTKQGSKSFTITATNSEGTDSKKLTLTVNELPEILTETLKEATLGKNYKQAVKTKGTKPLTWEIDGTLPEGITFDADKGKFSGTPTAITTGAVNITLTNSVGSVSQTYTLKVAGTPPKIGLSKLKDGKYGKSYTAKLKVKGSEPVTLTLVGELPEGLSFDSSAETITGTPTEACTDLAIRVIAANAADVVSRDYTLTIKAVAPKITTKKLPDAVKGKTYSTDIEVTGTPEITFTASGLPSGLSMNTSGEISGIPTKFGKFSVKVTAKNSAKTVKKSMNLTVLAAPEFSGSSTLTSGTQGKSYKHTFAATGSKTITFSIAKGSLPSGITLNAKKGTLKGKPTASGTFEFTVKAANSAGEASKDFTLTIATNTTNKSAYTYPDNGEVSRNISGHHGGNVSVIQHETPVNIGSDSDGGYIVVAELPEVSVDVSGMYNFSVELGEKAQAGEVLLWLANCEDPSEDDRIAEFFDETGQEIECVPENRRVNVSVWLNAGRVYRPAVAVRR